MDTTSSACNRSLEDAYRECVRIARRHYENFPVASLLLPRRMRKHVAAIYAFARSADDFADEPGVENRLERLADWESRLRRCIKTEDDLPLFRALGDTIRSRELPLQPFVDLLAAFREDVTTRRHRRFDDLLAYSRCSANPVGRLLLLLFGYRDETLAEESDAICTALQLTNFWQDVARDWERGRVYIPQEYMMEYGYTEADLENRVVNEKFHKMMARLVDRTRALFQRGRPLGHRLSGRFGLEIRMIWLGGTQILDNIERANYDVFRRRPELSWRDKMAILIRALRGQPRPESCNGS